MRWSPDLLAEAVFVVDVDVEMLAQELQPGGQGAMLVAVIVGGHLGLIGGGAGFESFIADVQLQLAQGQVEGVRRGAAGAWGPADESAEFLGQRG